MRNGLLFLWNLSLDGAERDWILWMRDDDYGETLRLNQTKKFESKANKNTAPVPPSPTQTCKELRRYELRKDE